MKFFYRRPDSALEIFPRGVIENGVCRVTPSVTYRGVLQEGIAFIQKPFTFNSLLEKTAKALAE